MVGANEVVRHSGALCGGGCGGAYGYLLEYLSGVGVNDRYVEVLGHLQAQFCLAYARRTEYYYQCFCHIIYRNKKETIAAKQYLESCIVSIVSIISIS